MKKILTVSICVMLLAVFALTACAPQAEPVQSEPAAAPSEAVAQPAEESAAPAAEEPAAPQEKYLIGFSNGYIGNGWRTQMIDSVEDLAAFYKGQGIVEDVIIQNAGLDVNTQIAQVRNMINAGVDCLIIDPNSETALNPVIEEAVGQGILVVCIDQPVTSESAYNVVIDQAQWGANLAEWLCKQLNGEGDIVIVEGLAGHPANVNRMRGMEEVLAANPGINVLTRVNGNWDQASAQQVMSDLLATYPDIDGVLTQDGMALGVVNAFEAAGRDVPVVTGELMMGFVKKWQALKEAGGFVTYGQNNPPGIGATGLGIAVRLLAGKEFKDGVLDGKTYYYPVKDHVTNDNFDTYYEKYKDEPDAYFIDEWLSEEDLDALFN
jgi:ribose transport system substrate-binding protein